MRFKVAVDQLTHRTAQARFTELQTMGKRRDIIAQLYGLDADACPQEISARILEFEFDADAFLGTSATDESASEADQVR